MVVFFAFFSDSRQDVGLLVESDKRARAHNIVNWQLYFLILN